ncbi:NADPH-Fe(3+) oxidoreductase subunit beta [Campylobacterota bacterium]|nr:NADPH-Fe(3+) oxidoreductase subunit beta [Campylobacterota bacterium]
MSALKLPTSFDDRLVRAFIGWDGVAIFDPATDVARLAAEYAAQYQKYSEACGRCMPGRAGGRILFDLLDKIARGEGSAADIAELELTSCVMRQSAKCEIGRTVPRAIDHLLTHFGSVFSECIQKRRPSAEYGQEREFVAKITAPCTDACPDRVDIPAFIEGVRDRQMIESVKATRKAMPLAHTCGRVCPHPCEDACRRTHLDEPLSIMELKRIGADYETSHNLPFAHATEKRKPIGKKVAIVGAGPAGLTCGYFLAMNGVECDIFEALPVAGGEVMVGVPAYRMPSEKYLEDIRFVADSGVKIHLNSPVDAKMLADFEKRYDAILLSFGARLSKKIRCENENEELHGYWGAISFLDRVNLWEKFRIGSPIDLSGKTVICVGGGFTSMDVVRCAVRANAAKVIMLYRRDEAALIANTSLDEYNEAIEEGVEFIFHSSISKIIDNKGTVSKVVCSRYEMRGDGGGGRPQLVRIEDADFELSCDYVIPAVSQESDMSFLPAEWEIGQTGWGTIKTDGKTYATSRRGVFSAGDCEYGPMTIVNAVGQGRRAAGVMLGYLKSGEVKRGNDEVMDDLLRSFRVYQKGEAIGGYLGALARRHSSKLTPEERKTNHNEVNFGFSRDEAIDEASRCMRCYYIAMAAL